MKLLCIDFSNLVVRQASNPYGSHTDLVGRPVWGAVGAVSQVLRLIEQHRPTHLLIARDGKREDLLRREISPEYKAHRPDADEDMTRQFGLAYEMVDMFGWPQLHIPRYEADDVIASACKTFPGTCDIVSGDKDLLALCSDRVTLWMFRPSLEAITVPGCHKIMGVSPQNVRDFKALVGDKSDGIAGVTGIGKVGAIKLIEAYGSVAGMYKHLDSGGDFVGVVGPSVQKKIEEGRAQARVSWQLAGLVENLVIDIDLLKAPDAPTWAEHEDKLKEKGLHGMQKALEGKKVTPKTGPLDMDLVFKQLQN